MAQQFNGAAAWCITTEEKAKHETVFNSLKPKNGKLTGDQAKKYLMLSNLPTPILGLIWTLSDLDKDGMMTLQEFSIAMYLTQSKLKGIELPRVLPYSLQSSSVPKPSSTGFSPSLAQPIMLDNTPVMSNGVNAIPLSQPVIQPISTGWGSSAAMSASANMNALSSSGWGQAPSRSNTWSSNHTIPNSMPPPMSSIPSAGVVMNSNLGNLTTIVAPMSSPTPINIIPAPKRLKYTQMFKAADHMQIGHLGGELARQLLIQSNIAPQKLAAIWELSDLNKDGNLDLEEFIIAMHLIDCSKSGLPIPDALPNEIIPPQYKYQRSDSITGQPGPVRSDSISSGTVKERTNSVTESPGSKMVGFAASFEDRKKDNFERGRMELERRRRELQEKETKRKEEKERIKREEEEKARRAREEAELKRQHELENERKQKEEMEREQEVLRKKMIEQRLAAQVEAERQRQREWEKRKKEELLNQKGIERDIVAGLKTRLTKLQIELKAQTAIRDDLNNSLKENNVESVELSSMVTRLNQARDVRIREINQLQIDIRQSSAQLRFLKEDHERLGVEMNKRDSTTTSEAYGGVRSSIHEMRGSLAKMRNNIVALQAEAAVISKERKKCTSQASELSSSIQEKLQENVRLKRNFEQSTKDNRIHQAKKKAEEEKRKADLLSWQKKQAEERIKSEAEAKKRKEEFEKKKNNEKSKKQVEKDQAKIKAEEIKKIALERKKVKKPEVDISSQQKEIKRQDEVVQKQQESLVARPTVALKPGMLPPPQDNKKDKKPVAVPRPRPSSTSTLGIGMSPFDAIKFEDENRKKEDEKKQKKEDEERQMALKAEEKRRKEMAALKQKKEEADAKKKSKEEEVKRKVEEMQKKRLQRKSQKKPPGRPAAAPVATSPQLARPPQPVAAMPKVSLSEMQTSSAPVVSVTVIPSTRKTTKRYKMIYAFEKRNNDELSLEENDIVTVTTSPDDPSPPPAGWLSGTCKGNTGLFPTTYAEELPAENFQDYVELDPKSMVRPTSPSPSQASQGSQNNETLHVPETVSLASSTEDIYAVPVPGNKPIEVFNAMYDAGEPKQSYENVVPPTQRSTTPTVDPSMINRSSDDEFQVVALYQYRALKDDQLSFNKNDNINVQSQDDIWWYGECQGKFGWFPKSYVRITGSNNGSVSLDDKTDQVSIASSTSSLTTESQNNNNSGADAPVIGECIAIFDYAGEDGDLHFMEGDVITITKKDSEWWEGYCNGKFGLFPENYVQMKEPETRKKKPDVATVTSSFIASGEKEVSLTPGQLIHVIQKNPSGWWQGEIQARGKKKQLGWFPASHVQLLGQSKQLDTSRVPSPALSNTASDGGGEDIYSVPVKPINQRQAQGQSYQEVPIRKSDNENQALAVYSYSAQQDDELTFCKGSVLKVISQDSDWWKGELNGLVGVFPSNYVQLLSTLPDQDLTRTWSASFDKAFFQSMSHMERERQNSVYELIDTEQAYMNDLSLTLEIFYNPLAEAKILTEHELNLVFVNWKQLIMCNMKLLKGMLVRKTMSSNNKIEGIGDILVEQLPNFTPYIRFCSCQLKACKFLQMKVENDPVFKQFEKKCAGDSRLRQNLPLSSYLLKPLQRITKYPLLIQRILKYTPEEHHDRPELEVSLEKAEELCSQINEAVRSQESSDRLEWLQSRVVLDGIGENLVFNSQTNCLGQRKFLYHGTLYKQKSNKELKAVLFNDFLLLCRIQSSHFGTKPMVTMFSDYNEGDCTLPMYKTPIFLNEVTIKQPNGPEVNEFVFHLSHIDRVYSFRTDTKTERNAWVSKINKASEHYIETERFQRQRAHRARSVLGQGYGKLLVTIIEGSDLKASDPTGTSDPYCEASMGSQEHKTKVIPKTLNPKWNSQMCFTVKDHTRDVLCITVFDRDFFSPNDFLGRTEVSLASLLAEGKGPWTKRLLLHEVATGELLVRFEIQTFVT